MLLTIGQHLIPALAFVFNSALDTHNSVLFLRFTFRLSHKPITNHFPMSLTISLPQDG
jgi:hypothetical protein